MLDLVKIAGRQFAKYAATFDPSLVVSKEDVVEYEMNVQTHLFDRVGASVRDAMGRVGGLAERLRSMGVFCSDIPLDLVSVSRYPSDLLTCHVGSIVKGKERQSDDYRFVSVILGTTF